MRDRINASGAHFISCDGYEYKTNLSDKDKLTLGLDFVYLTYLIVEKTLALDDKIIRDMSDIKPDVIVSDSLAYWGKLAAFKLGIPFVSSTTTFAFNRYSSKIMKQSGKNYVKLLFSLPKINKCLNRLRAKGYEIKNILSVIANDNDTNTIVYTAPEFQPRADTFSKNYSFVGVVIRPVEEAMKKPEKKLIYISLGTVNNHNYDFYKNCIDAFGDGKYSVVISAGENIGEYSFEHIPENINITRHVDQIAILGIADVFLTHCGMNSVNEALYFGVPMVLYPRTLEQSGVALRAETMGAGILLKNDSAVSVRASVEMILNDGKYKESAKKLSGKFRLCGGAKGAADAIEKLIV
jgi:MGT family glycosyltransferase